jgi:hypothetical protein
LLAGEKKEGYMYFCPYSNHFLGHHGYKKFDGNFPCKDRADAIAIFLDLVVTGELKPNTAGIIVHGGDPVIEKITLRELEAEAKKKQSGK